MSGSASESILITLTPARIHLAPDAAAADILVRVRNNGSGVDQYAVEIDGLPTTWYTLSSTSVALFPQDEEDAMLTVRPPRGAVVKPGSYPFTVVVLSRADPSLTARTDGLLEIGAIGGFEWTLSPPTQTGRKGRYALDMRNESNTDLDVAVSVQDDDAALRSAFNATSVQVEPHNAASTTLTVRVRRARLVGLPQSHAFQVTATPSQGEPITLSGEFVYAPLLRTWKPVRWLLLLVLLTLVVLALAVATSYRDGNRSGFDAVGQRVSGVLCTRFNVLCSPTSTMSHPKSSRKLVFVHGFAALRSHVPKAVGYPLENEHRTTHGDVVQATTTGLLVYDSHTHISYFIAHNGRLYRDGADTRIFRRIK